MPSFSTTAVDSDGDGLSDDIEDAAGLDRLDMDTDDDGVIDGMERGALIDSDEDGLINALDTDSDNDGLSDGLEMGLTEISEDPDGFGPIKSTNVEKGAVVMDTDSATTTNMTLKDTDGGGLMDNEEDANLNGKMDIGETDPNNPNDDTNPTFATGGGGGGGCVLVAEASSFDITFMIMLFVFLIFCICYPSKAFKRGSIFLSGGSVKTEEDMK